MIKVYEIEVNFHTMPLLQHRVDHNHIGWSSIPDYIIEKPAEYFNEKIKSSYFDIDILKEMIYDICQTVDKTVLLKLEKKYIKIDKIKINSINILKTYGEITDLFYLVWEVPCAVDGKQNKYYKRCVFTYDQYKGYLRDKKLNDIL